MTIAPMSPLRGLGRREMAAFLGLTPQAISCRPSGAKTGRQTMAGFLGLTPQATPYRPSGAEDGRPFGAQNDRSDAYAEAQRRAVRAVGALLARLHRAGCFFRGQPEGLGVRATGEVVLESAAGLVVRRRFTGYWRRRDLRGLCRVVAEHHGSRTDQIRVLRGYVSVERR